MTDATKNDDAFEALQQFADVWHDKYAKPASAGENRKPPSLTMRANGVAAVLTEPQLGAVVAEYARMQTRVAELEAHPWQLVREAQDEQDTDVRTLARLLDLIECDPESNYAAAIMAVRDRYADRIAALDARDADMDDLNDMAEEAW